MKARDRTIGALATACGVSLAGGGNDTLLPALEVGSHRRLPAGEIQVIERLGPEQPGMIAGTAVVEEDRHPLEPPEA
jgi:hypothetical protein